MVEVTRYLALPFPDPELADEGEVVAQFAIRLDCKPVE